MAGKRSNGEGQLRQRKDGLWELQIMIGYHDDGRRKMKSFYGKTQREVREKAFAYKRDKEAGLDVDHKLTFGEWADTWYVNHEKNVSPSTYENYKYTLAIVKAEFGRQPLRAIKAMHIERFLHGLVDEGRSESYVTKCRAMLSQIFTKAEANDLVPKNPTRLADKVRNKTKNERKQPFTRDELRMLLTHLPQDRIGQSIRLMLITGIRTQEMLALQPEHIEPDGSVVHVRQAVKMLKGTPYIGETKTVGSVRDIPVPELFRYVAIDLRERAGVFLLDRKVPGLPVNPQNYREWYYKALESVEGVQRLTPHSCRHTYISTLQYLGVDKETVRIMSGHETTKMTEHYTHTQQEERDAAAAKLSDAFMKLVGKGA